MSRVPSNHNLDALTTLQEKAHSKLVELLHSSMSSNQLKEQVDTINLLLDTIHRYKIHETELREVDENFKKKIQDNQISYVRKVLFLALGVTSAVVSVFTFIYSDQTIGTFIAGVACGFLGFSNDLIKTIFARRNIDE